MFGGMRAGRIGQNLLERPVLETQRFIIKNLKSLGIFFITLGMVRAERQFDRVRAWIEKRSVNLVAYQHTLTEINRRFRGDFTVRDKETLTRRAFLIHVPAFWFRAGVPSAPFVIGAETCLIGAFVQHIVSFPFVLSPSTDRVGDVCYTPCEPVVTECYLRPWFLIRAAKM